MAKVTITIEDLPDGTVHARLAADPPLPKPVRYTDAQRLAMEVLGTITSAPKMTIDSATVTKSDGRKIKL